MKRTKVAILSSFLRLGQWRGIMRFGQQAGWICQRIDHDTLPRLHSWEPDGLLYQVDEFDIPLLDYVSNSPLPKVGLRALPAPAESSHLVLRDLAAIGRAVANHFVARNYRRLCYLGPKSSDAANAGATHAAGMREVADAHGIPLECIYPDEAATWESLGLSYQRRSASDWDRFWELGRALLDRLTADPAPVAVFSSFAEPAMEFMEIVDERGLHIPGRIGIAAQTEDALNGLVTKVPMTCVVPDYELQGFEAGSLLERLLKGEQVAPNYRKFLADFELVLRESSNQIVTSDPLLEKMLEHIRKHALKISYTPEQLAAEFDRSLRTIQIRFRTSLGRGVAEVIREHRTHHAIELISKTELPMQQIFGQCGFSGHHQLERAVRAMHGKGPTALRKETGRN
jgi:DNA-binding LacI/PurR family transcriptional regulator